jgi:hypothetical protein
MNPKGYNGLRSSGLQVPIGSQLSQDERMRQAIALEMQALRREIYVLAASHLIQTADHDDGGNMVYPISDEYQDLAEASQLAARSYFVGLGVIQEQPESDSPATE